MAFTAIGGSVIPLTVRSQVSPVNLSRCKIADALIDYRFRLALETLGIEKSGLITENVFTVQAFLYGPVIENPGSHT